MDPPAIPSFFIERLLAPTPTSNFKEPYPVLQPYFQPNLNFQGPSASMYTPELINACLEFKRADLQEQQAELYLNFEAGFGALSGFFPPVLPDCDPITREQIFKRYTTAGNPLLKEVEEKYGGSTPLNELFGWDGNGILDTRQKLPPQFPFTSHVLMSYGMVKLAKSHRLVTQVGLQSLSPDDREVYLAQRKWLNETWPKMSENEKNEYKTLYLNGLNQVQQEEECRRACTFHFLTMIDPAFQLQFPTEYFASNDSELSENEPSDTENKEEPEQSLEKIRMEVDELTEQLTEHFDRVQMEIDALKAVFQDNEHV
ncbi:unnamed protein product [Caenorhabditis sp. 36 PRJEB53466]|nr:unnamed protein product [Caenorhabditis sp. 36 PRJEB53466]